MPRKKTKTTKSLKKSPAKKKAGRKVAKAPSYLEQIDKIYQDVKAKIKKSIATANQQGKQLKSQQDTLAKAQKASQKLLLALEKKNKGKVTAAAKSKMNKAIKAQKAAEAAIAQKQQAVLQAAADVANLKQQLELITREEQQVAEFRKTAKPSQPVVAKAKKEKKAKVTKAAKPVKAKKASKAAATDFDNEKDQLALVMEEDFMAEDEATDKEHI